MGDYSMITHRKWLWPLIELGAVLLWTARETYLRNEQRNAARCHATHCAHH